jgi:hypothetical protein
LPFLLAVALVAAALGDAFVESVSNSGIFGRGYSDDNRASVLPTLLLGGLVALEVLRRRCSEMLDVRVAPRTDWLVDFARRYARGSPASDLAVVLGLQFAALFAMESAEQLAFGGKLPVGFAWLGGPMVFSLLAHALIGAGCSVLLARFVRAILATVATLVRGALDSILLEAARATAHIRAGRREEAPQRRAQAPHARQSGDRAPPIRPFAHA